ncbi:hypothetical protein ACHAXA_002677 [Cyclostephanos tholiformis]|uniref:25S rRNA (uridine-N(3))-methyltransferase BMT5-like domain-containing protein n=1 Tax=Cyclostephanos tholiformis TaxID=382380 RepID=A0ABD3S045_9STRA
MAPYPTRDVDRLYCPRITHRCAIGALHPSPSRNRRPPSVGVLVRTSSHSSCHSNPPPPCVACAYKICNFDVALDVDFTSAHGVPNARPESCPRYSSHSSHSSSAIDDDDVGDASCAGYRGGMRVLSVGDGDFSFSLAISRVVLSSSPPSGNDDGVDYYDHGVEGGEGEDEDGNRDGGSKEEEEDEIVEEGKGRRVRGRGRDRGLVVATSYENEETLRSVYPDFDVNLRELTVRGGGGDVVVAYNVDATRLVETLPGRAIARIRRRRRRRRRERHLRRTHPASHSPSTDKDDIDSEYESARGTTGYHRICWNFPCTAIRYGQDGQNDAMERNRELIRQFVSNSLSLLDETCGEIHMIHKTKPPYNQWLLEEVALGGGSMTISSSTTRGDRTLEYKGRIVFDRCIYRPYTPRKALDRGSFPCHDACVYVFGWRGGGMYDEEGDDRHRWKTIPPPPARSDRTTMMVGQPCDDDDVDVDALPGWSSSIMPVTAELIDEIRSIHIAYAKERKAEMKRHHPSSAPPLIDQRERRKGTRNDNKKRRRNN